MVISVLLTLRIQFSGMTVLEFLWKYIAGPVMADAMNATEATWRGVTAFTGYNPVNTIAWAVLAVFFGVLVYQGFQRWNVRFDTRTVLYSVPFILLGGVLRFIEDTGAIPFELRVLLITPVIYFLVAGVYFGGLALARKLEGDRDENLLKIGAALLAAPLVYALYFMVSTGIDWVLLAGPVLVAGVLTAAFYALVKDQRFDRPEYHLIAFSQFFGGAVSMISVTQGYVQKQLVAQLSTQLFGAPGILLVKTAFLALALYVLKDIDEEVTRAIIVMFLTVIGLATGLRVLFRLSIGI